MRRDARDLLEKLGRRGLRYREFSDSAADMDLWPIFEALLRDPRVVGAGSASAPDFRENAAAGFAARPPEAQTARTMPAALSAAEEVGQRAEANPSRGASSLFGQYRRQPPGHGKPGGAAPVSIRTFLARLADED